MYIRLILFLNYPFTSLHTYRPHIICQALFLSQFNLVCDVCFFAPTFSYFNEFITIGMFLFLLLDFDKVLSMMV